MIRNFDSANKPCNHCSNFSSFSHQFTNSNSILNDSINFSKATVTPILQIASRSSFAQALIPVINLLSELVKADNLHSDATRSPPLINPDAARASPFILSDTTLNMNNSQSVQIDSGIGLTSLDSHNITNQPMGTRAELGTDGRGKENSLLSSTTVTMIQDSSTWFDN